MVANHGGSANAAVPENNNSGAWFETNCFCEIFRRLVVASSGSQNDETIPLIHIDHETNVAPTGITIDRESSEEYRLVNAAPTGNQTNIAAAREPPGAINAVATGREQQAEEYGPPNSAPIGDQTNVVAAAAAAREPPGAINAVATGREQQAEEYGPPNSAPIGDQTNVVAAAAAAREPPGAINAVATGREQQAEEYGLLNSAPTGGNQINPIAVAEPPREEDTSESAPTGGNQINPVAEERTLFRVSASSDFNQLLPNATATIDRTETSTVPAEDVVQGSTDEEAITNATVGDEPVEDRENEFSRSDATASVAVERAGEQDQIGVPNAVVARQRRRRPDNQAYADVLLFWIFERTNPRYRTAHLAALNVNIVEEANSLIVFGQLPNVVNVARLHLYQLVNQHDLWHQNVLHFQQRGPLFHATRDGIIEVIQTVMNQNPGARMFLNAHIAGHDVDFTIELVHRVAFLIVGNNITLISRLHVRGYINDIRPQHRGVEINFQIRGANGDEFTFPPFPDAPIIRQLPRFTMYTFNQYARMEEQAVLDDLQMQLPDSSVIHHRLTLEALLVEERFRRNHSVMLLPPEQLRRVRTLRRFRAPRRGAQWAPQGNERDNNSLLNEIIGNFLHFDQSLGRTVQEVISRLRQDVRSTGSSFLDNLLSVTEIYDESMCI